jgi:hypothetical protein
LASLGHCVEAADAFNLWLFPHKALAHVALGVQQLVAPASPPRAMEFFAASWYLPAPHDTLATMHFLSSQHVACTQDLASVGHFAEAAEAIAFVPTLHVALAHVALCVQQLVTPESPPRAWAPLVESLYFPAPHVTLASLHVFGAQHVACAQDLALLGHFIAAAEATTLLSLPHMALAHVATGVQQLLTPASPPRGLAALVLSWYLAVPHVTFDSLHLTA